MKRAKRGPAPGEKRRRLAAALVLAGLCLLLGLLAARVHPLLVRLAASRAEGVTRQLINEQAAYFLAEQGLAYGDLVEIHTREDGRIAALTARMAQLNGMKATLAAAIQRRFNETDFGDLTLPLGTLVGGDFLLGRGPAFHFRLTMSCAAECDFVNVFDSAGINQTRHQILLKVTGRTLAVAPWCKTSVSVTTSFVIAETVLVGEVPTYYTNVTGSADPMDDVNNYGAEPGD